jgi:hypothetical protein
MKGQPLTYNKDNQEDKEPLFDSVDTLLDTLRAFAEMLPGLEVDTAAMRSAAEEGYSTATDYADYLVRRGLPFRDAHEAVAQAERARLRSGAPSAGRTAAHRPGHRRRRLPGARRRRFGGEPGSSGWHGARAGRGAGGTLARSVGTYPVVRRGVNR